MTQNQTFLLFVITEVAVEVRIETTQVSRTALVKNKTSEVEEVDAELVEDVIIELATTAAVLFVLKIILHQNVQIGQQRAPVNMSYGV